MNRIVKAVLISIAVAIWLPSGAQAQPVLSKAFLAVGTGATFTALAPAGIGVWVEMMRVGPISVPTNVACEVTASFTAPLGTNLIQTTLHTVANARGSWVQVHTNNGDSAGGWVSSAMTQCFNIPAGLTTFYMNGENRAGAATVTTQNTRMYAVCRVGAVCGSAASDLDAYDRSWPGNQ